MISDSWDFFLGHPVQRQKNPQITHRPLGMSTTTGEPSSKASRHFSDTWTNAATKQPHTRTHHDACKTNGCVLINNSKTNQKIPFVILLSI